MTHNNHWHHKLNNGFTSEKLRWQSWRDCLRRAWQLLGDDVANDFAEGVTEVRVGVLDDLLDDTSGHLIVRLGSVAHIREEPGSEGSEGIDVRGHIGMIQIRCVLYRQG